MKMTTVDAGLMRVSISRAKVFNQLLDPFEGEYKDLSRIDFLDVSSRKRMFRASFYRSFVRHPFDREMLIEFIWDDYAKILDRLHRFCTNCIEAEDGAGGQCSLVERSKNARRRLRNL